MKSLKKTLCLVLALVMVMSMFGLASATKFTDDNSIQYKEAVEVMTGLEAINGYPDGTFVPKGNINRAEAAKLIAYTILGPDVAGTLSGVTSRFTDMNAPAYSWAIPYVEYLATKGIIDGIGGGLFNPGGQVTGYELGKMLLVAVGYGAKKEYVGAGWDLQVAIDAAKHGIYDDRKANANKLGSPASREEAALYCFNALSVTKVAYSPLLDAYIVNGILGGEDAGSTIGWDVYNLWVNNEDSDAYGRPINTWNAYLHNKYKDIATVPATPVYTTSTAITAANLNLALKNLGYKIPATFDLYTNGHEQLGVPSSNANTSYGGNGVLIEVYADSSDYVYRIVAVTTYLGTVTVAAQDNAATTNLDERKLAVVIDGKTTYAYPAKNDAGVDATVGFEAAWTAATAAGSAGAKLLAQPYDDNVTAGARVLKLAAPTSKSITPSLYSATRVVADGETYYYSKFATSAVASLAQQTVLLDEYGYIIGAPAAAGPTYGVLLQLGSTSDGWTTTNKARILTTSGEVLEVVVASNVGPAAANDFVQYAQGTSGYTITKQTLTSTAAATTVTKGSANLGGVGTGTAQTIFFVQTGTATAPVYTVYQGIYNVPSLNATGADRFTVSGFDGVLLKGSQLTGTAANWIYFTGLGTNVTTSSGTALETQAVVNGVVRTVNVDPALTVAGYYSAYTESNGVIVGLTGKSDVAFTTVTYSGDGNVLNFGSGNIAVSSNCVVFVVSASGKTVTASSLGAIAGLTGVTGGAYVADGTTTQVTAVFINVA